MYALSCCKIVSASFAMLRIKLAIAVHDSKLFSPRDSMKALISPSDCSNSKIPFVSLVFSILKSARCFLFSEFKFSLKCVNGLCTRQKFHTTRPTVCKPGGIEKTLRIQAVNASYL